MTLDQFLEQAPLSLQAWAAATRAHVAEGTEGFVGEQFENRSESDWWREVAAYHEYLELEARLAQDRRATVERRSPRRR